MINTLTGNPLSLTTCRESLRFLRTLSILSRAIWRSEYALRASPCPVTECVVRGGKEQGVVKKSINNSVHGWRQARYKFTYSFKVQNEGVFLI